MTSSSQGWSPPQQGFIKVNIDAAFEGGRIAAAMVVRNEHGYSLYLASKLFRCESSFVVKRDLEEKKPQSGGTL
ncbi:hypothetical protein FNV43_RR06525 [Rhamnella rubrinervis]|uniref:Uncharacterized protein n=1 Tax=Rhamnella rubrinervis TaxID=2594499 RepID=A0A8K0MLV5_9ROSA|nr:hypothetical protein FNV43_RR06525 [Rhamnella rubrinervis]